MRKPRRSARPAFRHLPLGRAWCDALRHSFGRLTAEEIRFRFHHPLTELTPEHARRLAEVDRRRSFALVLVKALPPERTSIGGVARAAFDADRSAEFAIIVGREVSGFGLGRHLLMRRIEWYRKRRSASIYGDVMIENERMVALARSLGFTIRVMHGSAVRIELSLRQGSAR